MIEADEVRDLSLFARSRLALQEPIQVGSLSLSCQEIIQHITPLLTVERVQKLEKVISGRSFNVIPVLENIHDLGNVSAVMRSSESFGFLNVHLVSPPGAR